MKKYLLANVIALIATLPASAADLNLTCQLKITDGGAQYNVRRKYEFNFDSMHVNVFQNNGNGYSYHSDYDFIRADSARIVLREDSEVNSYIDRSSGDFYHKNNDNGYTIRGNCERATPSGNKF